MASTPPSQNSGKKRPWYLVVALIGAWVFGASGMTDGCRTIAFYNSDTIDTASAADTISDDADRAAVKAITEHYLAAVDAAKARVYPLGIASLLLGGAMWGFAAGAMAGRPGARKSLLQVLCVQTALVALGYFLTPDVRVAAIDAEAKLRALGGPPKDAGAYLGGLLHVLEIVRNALRNPAAILGLRIGANVLVLVALTRARTRTFFEVAKAAADR